MKISVTTKKPRKPAATAMGPKAKLHAGWTYLGQTLERVIHLQRAHEKLPLEQQISHEGLLQKLRIYEESIPHLMSAFEQLAEPVLGKQAGGRPTNTKAFLLAWAIAKTHFEKNGVDLSGENLSRITSKRLLEDYPEEYQEHLGWDALGEEDIARPFPKRTASECLRYVKVSRPHE
jgi:hypothetical protein